MGLILADMLAAALQDDVFYNTYGFGKDSSKMAKEFGEFKDMFFNAAEQVRYPNAPLVDKVLGVWV